MNKENLRPLWAEINLDHLSHNMKEVKRNINKDTLACAVIKADGYGHGAVEIAETLVKSGADRFAVATLTEAVELRKSGITLPIMVLGYTPETQFETITKYNITQTIYTYEQGKCFNEKALERGEKITVHIKVDTGMSRLGFQTHEQDQKKMIRILGMKGLIVEGIYTHFAIADDAKKDFTYLQFEKFQLLVKKLEAEGFNIPIKHVSNSAAIIDLPEMNLDMVRAGLMLYGLYPSKDVDHRRIKLKKVLELKAEIALVKDLEKGRGVSYGLIYETRETRRIATLPVGYADGFTRLLTEKAKVMLKGKAYPIVGRICMDQSMVDITGEEANIGDVVTVISSNDEDPNTADDFADLLGTINYEIVCMISRRVPRVYLMKGEVWAITDHLLTRQS
ncbi:alanine racemase [Isachenkonia alkalipeptolytica]|uniref:Alanine racemase n=1 Tax=Isachenkonia alkalipeptolytica TaxID=2565777 RepID=A0AA43XIQ3_9CLOT|nr:alanine racemase [Isachenkonia alkalipeptolytica]